MSSVVLLSGSPDAVLGAARASEGPGSVAWALLSSSWSSRRWCFPPSPKEILRVELAPGAQHIALGAVVPREAVQPVCRPATSAQASFPAGTPRGLCSALAGSRGCARPSAGSASGRRPSRGQLSCRGPATAASALPGRWTPAPAVPSEGRSVPPAWGPWTGPPSPPHCRTRKESSPGRKWTGRGRSLHSHFHCFCVREKPPGLPGPGSWFWDGTPPAGSCLCFSCLAQLCRGLLCFVPRVDAFEVDSIVEGETPGGLQGGWRGPWLRCAASGG